MKIVSYILSLLLVVAFVGCNKVPLEPDSPSTNPTPVFSAAITINGVTDSIAVGENSSLSTYHQIIGEGSYVGTTFENLVGDDLLSFEFGFIDQISQNSFNSGFDFGSLNGNYELDVNNVLTNIAITNYAWIVNGNVFSNINAVLSNYGTYDVVLHADLADGSVINLTDRIILGGLETNEPIIQFTQLNPLEFAFSPVNMPGDIDSVRWEATSQQFSIAASSELNFVLSLPIAYETFVLKCSFFSNGELVNYKSEMHASPFYQGAPIVDMSPCVEIAEIQALPLTPRGKATYNYNGDTYTTKNGTTSSFQLNNVQQFIDEYSADTFLKGEMEFASYLYNNFGDSIYVEIESEIGFSDVPE